MSITADIYEEAHAAYCAEIENLQALQHAPLDTVVDAFEQRLCALDVQRSKVRAALLELDAAYKDQLFKTQQFHPQAWQAAERRPRVLFAKKLVADLIEGVTVRTTSICKLGGQRNLNKSKII